MPKGRTRDASPEALLATQDCPSLIFVKSVQIHVDCYGLRVG